MLAFAWSAAVPESDSSDHLKCWAILIFGYMETTQETIKEDNIKFTFEIKLKHI